MSGIASLRYVLSNAYGLSYSRIVGQESSLNEVYEIAALAPAETSRTIRMQMLQTMLVERLGLKYHLQEKSASIYALSVGSGPLKLTPTTDGPPARLLLEPGQFKQKSASMAEFVFYLTGQMDREVVDFTGLEGRYAFNLDWKEENSDPGNWVEGPRGMMHDPRIIFKAVKMAGLKMEARTVGMKYLIIDHVNKEPGEN
jgi:uncharacterized protein (TIGR03435 family)